MTESANASGVVGQQEVPAVIAGDAFGAHARRYDGLALRHGVDHLQARAAADPQRHDVDGRLRDPGTHVGDEAGRLDRWIRARRPPAPAALGRCPIAKKRTPGTAALIAGQIESRNHSTASRLANMFMPPV